MTAKDNTPEPAALSEADFDGDLPALESFGNYNPEWDAWRERHWEMRRRRASVLEAAARILGHIAGAFPANADAQAVDQALKLAELLVAKHAARSDAAEETWLAVNPEPSRMQETAEPSDD